VVGRWRDPVPAGRAPPPYAPAVVALRQVMVPVADLDRAVAFYRDVLGLPLLARFDPPGLVFFDLAGVRLLLEHGSAPSSGTLYLAVDDVEEALDRLRQRGVAVVGEPHLIHRDDDGTFGEAHTEEWMAFVTDSEGNTLGLSERRAPRTS
jgi:methylmalonyl-CoA/ethylmalonyl-CoA epimerase